MIQSFPLANHVLMSSQPTPRLTYPPRNKGLITSLIGLIEGNQWFFPLNKDLFLGGELVAHEKISPKSIISAFTSDQNP